MCDLRTFPSPISLAPQGRGCGSALPQSPPARQQKDVNVTSARATSAFCIRDHSDLLWSVGQRGGLLILDRDWCRRVGQVAARLLRIWSSVQSGRRLGIPPAMRFLAPDSPLSMEAAS